MLIESIIRRTGGSHIDIAGIDWHFKPAADGQVHVCDVTDDDAADILLAIPEGFRQVEADSEAMLITDGEQSVDLMTLGKKALLAFAKDKFKVDAMLSAQALRESIYQQAKA